MTGVQTCALTISSDLPSSLQKSGVEDPHLPAGQLSAAPWRPVSTSSGPWKTLRQVEEEMIWDALDRNRGDKPAAAKDLGIALKTLYNQLTQIGEHRNAG